MVAWYRVLPIKTKAYIRVAGFKLIIRLLLEQSASAILVQTLAEKWWDTTHTFYIADRDMIVTSNNFHHMTDLRCDRALINLERESSIQLGIELLRRRNTTETVYYFDIKADDRPFP